MKFAIIVFSLFVITSVRCDDCHRPEDLKDKEDLCWRSEVEIVDRVVQTSRSVLNLAKKKLGMAVEDENEVKKCSYYVCIMRQLHMLNAHDYPNYDNIKSWTENNVIYFQATGLINRLDKCNEALMNSTANETLFDVDQVDKDSEESKDGTQTPCELAGLFIDCLSRQKLCPVFVYP